MSSDKFDVKPGEHIPGEVINTYLRAYAQEFGIIDFVQLETLVLTAEHRDTAEGGWDLTVKPLHEEHATRISAHRLVIATGLLSEPFMPSFTGQDKFDRKIFHSRDFPQNLDTLKAKTVTVFGAGKSGWDAVYKYATAGVKVNWVIRCMSFRNAKPVTTWANQGTTASGHGPCWMAPPYVTPFKKWIEKLASKSHLSYSIHVPTALRFSSAHPNAFPKIYASSPGLARASGAMPTVIGVYVVSTMAHRSGDG